MIVRYVIVPLLLVILMLSAGVASLWMAVEQQNERIEAYENWFRLGEDELSRCRDSLQAVAKDLGNCGEENVFLYSNCVTSCPECECPFSDIAREVANNHSYGDTYNCLDFTEELVSRLREEGYEAYTVTGHVSWEDDLHAWTRLCVNIESTTGEVLEPAYFN